jgi:hypothetical protein
MLNNACGPALRLAKTEGEGVMAEEVIFDHNGRRLNVDGRGRLDRPAWFLP